MDNIRGILDDIKATDSTIESISAFKDLLEKSNPETTTKLVVEEVLPHIFKSDTKNRKELLNLIFDCTNVDAKYLNKKDAARFKLHVKQEFLNFIDKLGDENNSDWSILCIALFRILGKILHNDVEIINRILRIIEIGFRNKSVEQKCAAYKCWMELIRNYSLSPSYMRQPKQMKLLIKPLKVPLSRLACATEIRFDTFTLLLEAIDCDVMNSYVDFLQFAFNIENVATSKPTVLLHSFKNVWPKAAAVLFQSLGCEGNIEEICSYKTKICTLVDDKYFESNYKCIVYAARICSELTYQWCAKTNVKQIIEPLWTTIFNLSLNSNVQKNVLSIINEHFNELFRSASSNSFVYDYILTTVLEVVYKEPEINAATFRAEVIVPFLKLYIVNSTLHIRSRNDALAQLISFAYSSQTLCDLYPLMESLNYSEVLELIWFQCNDIFVAEVQTLRCIDILTYLKWPVGNIKFLNTNECILKLWKATLVHVYESHPDIISQLLDAFKLIQATNNWIIVNIMIISTVLLEIATRKITTMECIALTLSECLENSSRAIEHFVLYKEDFFDSYLNLSKYMTGNSAVLTTMLQSLEKFIQKLPALIIKSIPKIFVQFMDDSNRLSTSNEAVNIGIKLKPQALHSTPTTIISRAKKMASINYSPPPSKQTATLSSSSDISGFEHNIESSSSRIKSSFIDKVNKKSPSQKLDRIYPMNSRTKSIMEFADTAFVQIDKEVTVDVTRMSSQQRESLRRRRDDIPALYSDLSQSSQNIFSEASNSQQFDDLPAVSLENNGELEVTEEARNADDKIADDDTAPSDDTSLVITDTVDINTMAEGNQQNDSDDNKEVTSVDNNTPPNNDFQNAVADSENVIQTTDSNDADVIDESEGIIQDSPIEAMITTTDEDLKDVNITESSDDVITDLPCDEKKMQTEPETNNEHGECAIKSATQEMRITRLRPQGIKPLESCKSVSPKAQSKCLTPRGRPKKTSTQKNLNKREDVENKVSKQKSCGDVPRRRGRPRSTNSSANFMAMWSISHSKDNLTLSNSSTDQFDEQMNESSVSSTSIRPVDEVIIPPTGDSVHCNEAFVSPQEGISATQLISNEKQIAMNKLKNELNRLRMDIVGGDMARGITSKRVRKEKVNLSISKSPKKHRGRLSLCHNIDVNSDDGSSELKSDDRTNIDDIIDAVIKASTDCILDDNLKTSESSPCEFSTGDKDLDYDFKGFDCRSEIEKLFTINDFEQEISPLIVEPLFIISDNVISSVSGSSDDVPINENVEVAQDLEIIDGDLEVDGGKEVVNDSEILDDNQSKLEDDEGDIEDETEKCPEVPDDDNLEDEEDVEEDAAKYPTILNDNQDNLEDEDVEEEEEKCPEILDVSQSDLEEEQDKDTVDEEAEKYPEILDDVNQSNPEDTEDEDTVDEETAKCPEIVEDDYQDNLEDKVDTDGNTIDPEIEATESSSIIMDTQEPSKEAFLNISFIGSIEMDSHKDNDDVRTKDTLSIGIDEFETETCNTSTCKSELANGGDEDLIPSSPVSNTTPSKNKNFVDDTLDISPIGGTTANAVQLDLGTSPDVFESESVDVIEKVLEESKSTTSLATETSKITPCIEVSKASFVSHLTPLKMQASSGVVSSPKTHRIQKMMQKLGDCSTPDNKESVDSRQQDSLNIGETYKKEDLLEFCANLPKPDARPRTPSILKRKAPDYLEEGISPLSKRKRVNFSDPPTTSSKVYLKCDEENFMQRVLKKSGKLSMKPHYLNKDNDMVFNIKVNIKNNASTSEARIENDCHGTMKEITCEANENVLDELSDLYPDLIDCNEDIDLLQDVTISIEEIRYTGVKTIGDIVRLKRADVQNLSGVPEPKFTRINSALSMYCCKHKNSSFEEQSAGSIHKIISVDCSEKSISNVNIINNIILSPKQMDTMIGTESPSGLTAISQRIKSNIQQLVNEGYSPDDIGDEMNNILRSLNLPLTVNLPYY